MGLPDNRLDSLALLDIVQPIEDVFAETAPQIVYTHFAGDLNRDHAITAEAVEIACRPLPGQTVEALYAFETVSSTEWSLGTHGTFSPQLFVDVSSTIDRKIEALGCYETEMRAFPHARSCDAVSALATLRGAQSGMGAAEAFMIRRETRR
jgi:LmbE family N-acetylglucosaminyl deacetylase